MEESKKPAPRALVSVFIEHSSTREELEEAHGAVWDSEELVRDFEIVGYLPPTLLVVRRSDGATGSLQFQPHPRYYYRFRAEK